MEFDKDLQSIQEVRDLVARASAAQKEFARFSQAQVDQVVRAIAQACAAQAERLAKLAVEETGFGVWQDKVLKNLLGSAITYDSIKDLKTVGILREDTEKNIWEIGVPMGVVAALIPSTNPTSTTMYKTLICLKAGNAIILSPHPNAKNCILETFQVISQAAAAAGAPARLVQCITTPTMEGTDALLKQELARAGVPAQSYAQTDWEPRPEREARKVPSEKAAARAGVRRYYHLEIREMLTARPDTVEIPLKMHIGAPCLPLVAPGDSVRAGQLIAQPPEGAMGALIHASMDGRVTRVDERIAITKE